jgi:hypothetical protein
MPQAHLSNSIHSNETVAPDRLCETASEPVELFDDSAHAAEKTENIVKDRASSHTLDFGFA